MIERKKYGITPLCESGKGKFISGAADFGAAARRGHIFHTRPKNPEYRGCRFSRKGPIPIYWNALNFEGYHQWSARRVIVEEV